MRGMRRRPEAGGRPAAVRLQGPYLLGLVRVRHRLADAVLRSNLDRIMRVHLASGPGGSP